MLEQSLHKLPPQDASLALLAFLRDELPAGGTAAEQRFVALFPILMERVCGRLIPIDAATNAASNATTTAASKSYQHSPDAWLSLPASQSVTTDPLVRLLRAPRCLSLDGSPVRATAYSAGRPSSSSPPSSPVITPTLLDAISAESQRVLIDYPLNALEPDLINTWRMWIQSKSNARAGVGQGSAFKANGRYVKPQSTPKEGSIRIDKNIVADQTKRLLELLPENQPALRQNPMILKSPASHVHSSPFGKSFGGSPIISKTPLRVTSPNAPSLGSPDSSTDNKEIEPMIHLSMLQYYLLLFIRYPLMENKQQPQYGRSTVNRAQSGGIYGYLFNGYLGYYLPNGAAANSSGISSDNTNAGIEGMHPTSELFLRLLIQFWLLHNTIPTTEQSLRLLRVDTPSLRDCLEMSHVSRGEQFKTLPSKVQNGILATTRHLVGDLSLREAMKRGSSLIQTRQKEEREGNAPPVTPAKDSSSPNTTAADDKVWCLPPAMSVIQQSLLNYIRMGLACGSIHNKDSSFHRALEVWLMWMEPWNFVVKKRIQGNPSSNTPRDLVRMAANAAQHKNVEYYSYHVRPKATSKSMYNPQWEAYVVSNVYFYVLPLAIFLRRARELEFSNASEFPRSLTLVQRVLRCYPVQIVNVLSGVLNSRADGVTSEMVSRHLELLGPHAPPNGCKLSSCQMDAMNLLEEMFGQYEKRVRNMNFLDRWEARIDGLFSGSMQREDGALQVVLEQLKCLVALPFEYSVSIEAAPEQRGLLSRFFGTSSEVDTVGPDRTSDGLLSDLGRRQLATGTRKCSPFDVHYIGDPMLAPYQSHEVPALVDLAIFVSNYLNDKLGFVPLSTLTAGKEEDMLTKNIREMERLSTITFRINLRFLADYRNVLAISFVIWLLRKVV